MEILGPNTQKTLEDMIYPLIQKGITQSKLYFFQISDDILTQLSDKKDGFLEAIWSMVQDFLSNLDKIETEKLNICEIICLVTKIMLFSKASRKCED